MRKYNLLLLFAILFMIGFNVQAKEVNHFVSKADSDVAIEDNYNASAAIAGDAVSVDGNVNGVSAAAGNKVSLNGTVDYGFFAGNQITMNGFVNKDVFIAGNLITTTEKANFERDVIAFGTDVELNGNFGRNVSIYANKVTIKNAAIGGNVKIYAESLVVSKDANINGTLYYPEDIKSAISKDATIIKIEKTPAIQVENDESYFTTLSAKIWSFLRLALVFAAVALFFPNLFNNINEKYKEFKFSEGIEVFTKGLVVFILVPLIAIILCLTMIGIPLGIILGIIYGIALYLTTIFTAYLIGYKIWQKVFNKEAHILLFGLIGLFVLLILELIPGVRIAVSIISVLVGLGLIFELFKNTKVN